MNDKINELYNNLDAKDKIINEQALEIARLNGQIADGRDIHPLVFLNRLFLLIIEIALVIFLIKL